MEKRGLSTIVVTLIIVLLSLVAIGVVWGVVNNLIKDNSSEVGISFTQMTTDLQLTKVYEDQGNLSVEVKRNAGGGDLARVEFIIYSANDSEIIVKNSSIQELNSERFSLALSKFNLSSVIRISVVPIFKLSDGSERPGDILDTYYVRELTELPSQGNSTSCSDGTGYGLCSTTKPSYCSSGSLIDNASVCGCPIGYNISGNSCIVNSTGNSTSCSDGTLYGQCSATKPSYCSSGVLVNNASVCGCPIGYNISGNNCVIISTGNCSDGTGYGLCSASKPSYCNNGNLFDNASVCGCPSGYNRSGNYCYNYNLVEITAANEQVVQTFNFDANSSSGWDKTYWASGTSPSMVWDGVAGHTNAGSLKIKTNSNTDAQWYYQLGLSSQTLYRLTGWVKGENITNQEGTDTTIGGRFEDDYGGWWEFATDNMGTYTWRKTTLIFSGSSTIRARLGGTGNTVTGKAWFDDMNITSNPLTIYKGEHITFMLEPSDISASGITEAKMKQWVINLDKVYDAYYDLIGSNPSYGSQNLGILSVPATTGWGACCQSAGNLWVISWAQYSVQDELNRVKGNTWTSFGIPHELGHAFDSCKWNCDWSGEFWANLKVYYATETLNTKVLLNGKNYTGSELANYFKTDSSTSYDDTLSVGTFSWDGLLYKFISIKNQIGWEPFKQTFRYFTSLGSAPATKLDKLNLFISKLTEYSGQNVRNMFTSTEWNAMMTEFS